MEEFIGRLFSPRKAEIVTAVLKLSDQVGIGNITTKRIAAEVGFAEGALYRHVRSKEDIFDLIIEAVRSMTDERAQEIRKEPDEETKLHAFFSYALSFLEQFPGLYHFIFSDAHFSQDKQMYGSFKALISEIQGIVADIIREGQESMRFSGRFDCNALAFNYLGTIHTAFTLWNVFLKRSQSLEDVGHPFFLQYLFLLKP